MPRQNTKMGVLDKTKRDIARYDALQRAMAEAQDLEGAASLAGIGMQVAKRLYNDGLPKSGLSPISAIHSRTVAAVNAINASKAPLPPVPTPSEAIRKEWVPYSRFMRRRLIDALKSNGVDAAGNPLPSELDRLPFRTPRDVLEYTERVLKLDLFLAGEVESRNEVVITTSSEHEESRLRKLAKEIAMEHDISEEQARAMLEESMAKFGGSEEHH